MSWNLLWQVPVVIICGFVGAAIFEGVMILTAWLLVSAYVNVINWREPK